MISWMGNGEMKSVNVFLDPWKVAYIDDLFSRFFALIGRKKCNIC